MEQCILKLELGKIKHQFVALPKFLISISRSDFDYHSHFLKIRSNTTPPGARPVERESNMTYAEKLINARREVTAKRRFAERKLLLQMPEFDKDLTAIYKRLMKHIELNDNEGFDLLGRLEGVQARVQAYNTAYSRESE